MTPPWLALYNEQPKDHILSPQFPDDTTGETEALETVFEEELVENQLKVSGIIHLFSLSEIDNNLREEIASQDYKDCEFVTILLLLYVLVLWPQGMWDPSFLTRERTGTLALEVESYTLDHQGSPCFGAYHLSDFVQVQQILHIRYQDKAQPGEKCIGSLEWWTKAPGFDPWSGNYHMRQAWFPSEKKTPEEVPSGEFSFQSQSPSVSTSEEAIRVLTLPPNRVCFAHSESAAGFSSPPVFSPLIISSNRSQKLEAVSRAKDKEDPWKSSDLGTGMTEHYSKKSVLAAVQDENQNRNRLETKTRDKKQLQKLTFNGIDTMVSYTPGFALSEAPVPRRKLERAGTLQALCYYVYNEELITFPPNPPQDYDKNQIRNRM
ncbi:hypothetical protein MJG53_017960 [Ovis ammon polii x Ovis aries]|uniref:Uncharacterized protein n=1 Tax=Ovis ammon polii x Ovis aries TaxID=2918886 RepID=A0ACB9U5J7_9CETA|nr:hypothetical protein MJG53_017960 [Ovis ammon polii x Ovis aries]